MMNRATLVYVLMIALFGGGLWAILSVGKSLTAPADLAGKWEPEGDAGPSPQMTIEQSGQFVEVIFADGPRLKMRVTGQRPIDPEKPRLVRMTLAAPGWKMKAEGESGGDEFTFALDGHQTRQTWQARRVERKYPVALGDNLLHPVPTAMTNAGD